MSAVVLAQELVESAQRCANHVVVALEQKVLVFFGRMLTVRQRSLCALEFLYSVFDAWLEGSTHRGLQLLRVLEDRELHFLHDLPTLRRQLGIQRDALSHRDGRHF